jgi:hypothetical protein
VGEHVVDAARVGLPQAHEREAAARSQGTADVGERCDGIDEERDPGPADGHVETALGERVDLGVALFEPQVGDAFCDRGGSCPGEHRF